MYPFFCPLVYILFDMSTIFLKIEGKFCYSTRDRLTDSEINAVHLSKKQKNNKQNQSSIALSNSHLPMILTFDINRGIYTSCVTCVLSLLYQNSPYRVNKIYDINNDARTACTYNCSSTVSFFVQLSRAERNSTQLDRKKDLNVLFQVCVLQTDRKIKMAALASDWLRHFRLLPFNHWTEFKETYQKTIYQRPLLSLCFSGRSDNQDGRPGLWFAETFSTSPL